MALGKSVNITGQNYKSKPVFPEYLGEKERGGVREKVVLPYTEIGKDWKDP